MDRIANIINSSDNKVATEIFVGIAICVAIYLVLYIIRMAMNKVSSSAEDSPVLLDGLVNAKYSRNVKQNPNEQYAKTLKRSMNENGIEYLIHYGFILMEKHGIVCLRQTLLFGNIFSIRDQKLRLLAQVILKI